MERCLFLCWILVSTGALAAATPEEAYLHARKSYYALKKDTARRKLRHHWQSVARKFEAVAAQFPKSARAPDALFTAGELLRELSRISMVAEDLEQAMGDYQKLCERYPSHRLADDGALALAKIQVDRLGRPDLARKILSHELQENPRGDRLKEIKQLLATLPEEATKRPRPKVVPPPPPEGVVASTELPASERTLALQPPPEEEAPAPRAQAPGEQTAQKLDESPAAAEEEVRPPPGPVDARTEELPASAEAEVLPAERQELAERLQKVAGKRRVEVTLAEQLGLKVRRVVIDPGHGGHDAGASGKGKTREKEVALAISKRLGQILASAGLEVVLTRDDDTYLPLEERARLANEAKGDLFISVHCNSAVSRKLKGIETYSLNTASDRYSIRLAARENASSERGISDLQFILADLTTKANTEESTRLAAAVQKNLVQRLQAGYSEIVDLGHKEALFYVLLGAKMPAILVETSFLSNPEEERRLSSKPYQEDVARAIAAGVREFLEKRQQLAKVD